MVTNSSACLVTATLTITTNPHMVASSNNSKNMAAAGDNINSRPSKRATTMMNLYLAKEWKAAKTLGLPLISHRLDFTPLQEVKVILPSTEKLILLNDCLMG